PTAGASTTNWYEATPPEWNARAPPPEPHPAATPENGGLPCTTTGLRGSRQRQEPLDYLVAGMTWLRSGLRLMVTSVPGSGMRRGWARTVTVSEPHWTLHSPSSPR